MPVDAVEPSETQPQLGEVVTAFLDALGDGLVPDRRALLAEHSDLAPELEEFFAAQDEVAFLTAPLRAVACAAKIPRHETDLDSAPDPHLIAVLEARGYELLGAPTHGGTAVVHKARQRRLNRLVAIKTIGVGRQISPLDVERFRNEAETLGALSHPNIVPVLEVAEHDGRLFLFMPYLEGGSLADNIEAYRDDPRKSAELLATVAHAIDHAHRHGILHRDLKPSNILLDQSGEPHVSDFGLARRLDMDSGLTISGAIVGTPSFMSPEQAQGRRTALSTSTDVYGLGTVLYVLLTGQPPFRGETALDTIEMVRNIAPTPPRILNPRVDRDLDTICLKCLEKEPKARYASAEALADDLESWQSGKPIAARPVGPLVKGWRWARRNRSLAGLAGLVATLLIAGTIGLAVMTAVLSRKNAEIARQRDQAKRAVDDMYTQAAERLLPKLPGMEKARREFLMKMRTYYDDQAAVGNGSSAAARAETANARFRVGRINNQLSEIDAAEQAYAGAVSLFDALATEFPHEPAYSLSLARSLNEIGLAYRTKGRTKEAEDAIRRSLDRAERAATEFPNRPEFRQVMAHNLHDLAILHHESERFLEAERDYRRAIGLREKLVAESPTDPDRRHELAAGLAAFAGLLSDARRPHLAEAEHAFRQALEIEEKLVANAP